MDGVRRESLVEEPVTVLDVHEMAKSLRSELNNSFIRRWREAPCSIFQVPPNLRVLDRRAYDPTIVSIGPYHWGNKNLMGMEGRKQRMARRLFSEHPDNMVDKCLLEVGKLEIRARSCYADKIKMQREDFVKMLILDGCFIIGLFLVMSEMETEDVHHRLVQVWWPGHDEDQEVGGMNNSLQLGIFVCLDLLNMENQIPWFIVETLYKLLVTAQSQSIIDLAKAYLSGTTSIFGADLITIVDHPGPYLHLFHLFYVALLSSHCEQPQIPTNSRCHSLLANLKKKINVLISTKTKSTSEPEWSLQRKRTATEIQEAGVKLVGKSNCSIQDASFENGVFQIPTLFISDSTTPHLRNLIAFEQCYPETNLAFSYYSLLMEFLINTPADVKVLRDAKIFTVLMCDEKGVAEVFSRMCREVWYSNENNRLLVAYGKVNRYCDLRRNKWRAMLVRNYFNSPWSFISVMVAVVLLILTLLQTFYTMFGYYHPPSA